jgi:hypothetical protein
MGYSPVRRYRDINICLLSMDIAVLLTILQPRLYRSGIMMFNAR